MSDTIKAFDMAAATYEDWYRTPKGTQVLQAELLGLKKLLPAQGLGVEIGAGTGIFAEVLTTGDRKIICLDPSPGMLKHAVKRQLPVIMATAEHLPIKEVSLDFAYLVIVLEFLHDPVQSLISVGKILKKNTPLITLTINLASPWGEAYTVLARRGDPIFRHANFYTLNEVVSFLVKAGYEPRSAVSALAAPPEELEEKIRVESVRLDAGVIMIKAIIDRRRRHGNPTFREYLS